MKKIILSAVAVAALTFASCKKDNLQPIADSTANTEQINLETSDQETNDDKAVDARNKFVGTWKRTGQGALPFKAIISKTTSNRLKIVETYSNGVQEVVYAKVGSNKLVFSTVEVFGDIKRTTTGTRNSTNVKKLTYKIVEKDVVTGQVYLNTTFNLVKQ